MATAKYTRIYWDSSCFICFLNKSEESRRLICEDVLERAQSGDILLYTSTFTISEVIRPKSAKGRRLTSDEITKINDMFRWKWLRKIDLDQRVGFKSQELSRDFGLKPGDAIHAASAILQNVQVLQNWDRDFTKVGHLIKVEEPQQASAQRLLISGVRKAIGPVPND